MSTLSRVFRPSSSKKVFSIGVRSVSSKVTFELAPCALHKLEQGPATSATCTRDDALKFYRQMRMIRRMQITADKMYKRKQIRGFCHLYLGQEACCVGMEAAITPNDAVITSHRSHGWAYVRGVTVHKVLAELTGKQTGCSQGKGGSIHMFGRNFFGGNGIVGAQVPIGAGIAFALKYKNTENICLAVYGDGAANQGQLFETFNIAMLWKLPCIFVCENNKQGFGTNVKRASYSRELYTRGDYMPGIKVNGMDVLAVKEATKFAINHVLNYGPLLMECSTYRYAGHNMIDTGTSYRTRQEVQEVKETRDPITNFKQKIIEADLVTEDEVKLINREVIKDVREAEKRALTDNEPPLEHAYNHVFANPDPDFKVRTCDPLKMVASK